MYLELLRIVHLGKQIQVALSLRFYNRVALEVDGNILDLLGIVTDSNERQSIM